GWWIGVVGIIGIIAACMYSAGNYSLAALGLGEVIGATFLGFVPFMLALVMQNAPIAGDMLLPGIPFVLLIASMILTNNIRDIQKDDGFRKTVPMRIGKRIAVGILYSLVIGAYLTIFILAWTKLVFWPVAMVVFALPMAIRLLRSVRKGASEEERQLGMKWSALHHWIFGLSYGAGIW